ncbi:MAG: GGDEF domain-containing protein [Myxococcota bacterium]
MPLFDEENTTGILDVSQLQHVRSAVDNRTACFIVLTGRQSGQMYRVDSERMIVGRAADTAIHIEDHGVSRRHAEIIHDSGEVIVQDLGSTNGTFCNGEVIKRRVLQDGDKIQIGTTTILKFSYQDSQEEDFTRRQYESVTRDGLTQCFNKKYFMERLPSELTYAHRHNQPLALVMFDLDHFKEVNDTYGHLAGDYVLRMASAEIQRNLRSPDVLARYGGEEFAIIMRNTSADAAFIAAERVRRGIEAMELDFDSNKIKVTISVGIAVVLDGHPNTALDLIASADRYLYKAKEGGRNRTESSLLD